MSRKTKNDRKFIKKVKEYELLKKESRTIEKRIEEYGRCRGVVAESFSTSSQEMYFQDRISELSPELEELSEKKDHLMRELEAEGPVKLKVSYDESGEIRVHTPSARELILLEHYISGGFRSRNIKDDIYVYGLDTKVNNKSLHYLKFGEDQLHVETYDRFSSRSTPSTSTTLKILSELGQKFPGQVEVAFNDSLPNDGVGNAGNGAKAYKKKQPGNETKKTPADDEYVSLVKEYVGLDEKIALAGKRKSVAEKLDDRENYDKYRARVKKFSERKDVLEKEIGLGAPAELVIKYDDNSISLEGRSRDFILANFYITGKLDPNATNYESPISQALLKRDFDRAVDYIADLRKNYSDEIRFIPKRIDRGGAQTTK